MSLQGGSPGSDLNATWYCGGTALALHWQDTVTALVLHWHCIRTARNIALNWRLPLRPDLLSRPSGWRRDISSARLRSATRHLSRPPHRPSQELLQSWPPQASLQHPGTIGRAQSAEIVRAFGRGPGRAQEGKNAAVGAITRRPSPSSRSSRPLLADARAHILMSSMSLVVGIRMEVGQLARFHVGEPEIVQDAAKDCGVLLEPMGCSGSPFREMCRGTR